MSIPLEAEELISKLEKEYPRVAGNIRLNWDSNSLCETFFQELLHYKADYDRNGFDMSALMTIQRIQELYKISLDEYRSNKNINLPKTDVWTGIFDKPVRKNRNPYS
jgi:hypothetical protein